MNFVITVALVVSVLVKTTIQQVRFEGEDCKNNDGVGGICKKKTECKTLGKEPKICSYDFDGPIFCCPNNTTPKPYHMSYRPPQYNFQLPQNIIDRYRRFNLIRASTKARQKCADYAKSVIIEIDSPVFQGGKEHIDQCALKEEPLVVGGERANSREFPHMAQIGFGKFMNKIQWTCGGSLISERYVISAGHCSNSKLGPARWVKLGELDTSTNRDDADPHVFKIERRIDHPEYNRSATLYHDISLFLLEGEVHFNAYIRPICLSTKSQLDIKTAIATGWGYTEWGGEPSDQMLKVKLNLITNDYCEQVYKTMGVAKLPKGIVDTQLCAGNQIRKDTCQGDSGGPLQSPLKTPYCMYELLGITTFGVECGSGHPGVYTRIVSFLPWIVDTVWPE